MERVAEHMRRHFIAVDSTRSVREVEELMRAARLRHLAVLDGPVLTGVISHRDLVVDWLGHLEREVTVGCARRLGGRAIAPLVLRPPEAVGPEVTLAEAAARMRALGIGFLPVVQTDATGQRVLGIVTESDLLAAAFGGGGGPR